MQSFPIIVHDRTKGVLVELFDATENPLYTMAVAWETMLGDPRKIIETGEYGDYMKEILQAKHKTVLEYISLSLRVTGVKSKYLYTMASCRAGFSVSVFPMGSDSYYGEIGCTFRALLDWIKCGIEGGVKDHRLVVPLLVNAVTLYNTNLGGVLEGACDGY